MPLGKPLDQFLRDALNLEITTGFILYGVTEPNQCFCQFVIVNVLSELLGLEHFVRFQGLPTVLDRILGCIEQDAMAVQVRV